MAVLRLLLDCGLRRGEVVGLRLGDVDLDRSVVTVTGKRQPSGCGKPGEGRLQTVADPGDRIEFNTVEHLNRHEASRPTPAVEVGTRHYADAYASRTRTVLGSPPDEASNAEASARRARGVRPDAFVAGAGRRSERERDAAVRAVTVRDNGRRPLREDQFSANQLTEADDRRVVLR